MSAEPGGVPSPVVEPSQGEQQTHGFVRQHLPCLRQESERLDHNPMGLTIGLKRALHYTDIGLTGGALSRSNNAVIGITRRSWMTSAVVRTSASGS